MTTPPQEPGPSWPSGAQGEPPPPWPNQGPQQPDQQYPGHQGYPAPQSYPGSPYPGQQYPGQQYPGQQYPDQPYPGQSYPGQQHAGQQYPAQPYPGQQYPAQPYGGQPYPGVPQPEAAAPYGAWQQGAGTAYPPGPYPQAGPGQGDPWTYPAAPVDLPVPAGPGSVHWPGRGTVAIPNMGIRLVARLIDLVIVVVGALVLGALVSGLVGVLDPTGSSWITGLGITLVVLISLCGPALYEISLLATHGATLGKRLMGIRVVRAEDARRLSWGRAAGRFLLPFAGLLLPVIGTIFYLLCCLSPFFDSTGRRQGWHDRVVRSVVIAPG